MFKELLSAEGRVKIYRLWIGAVILKSCREPYRYILQISGSPMKLTKSQRVKVIQDTADHLGAKDWSSIDLTLKQFGFPISNEWSGDTKSYIVDKIGDGNDNDLVD